MRSISIGFVVAISSLVALSAAACGSTESDGPAVTPPAPTPEAGVDAAPPVEAGPKVDNGAPSTTYPAPHPPLPMLENQAGGKVLAAPKVHLVFYPDYVNVAPVTSVAQGVGATSYWTAATSEYGVGAIAYDGATTLAVDDLPPATITDKAVEAYMNAKIAAGAFGTPDPSTIYTIVYPKTTSITLSGGGPFGDSKSCSSFGGYHSDTLVDIGGGVKKNVPFAVLPTCDTFGDLDEVNGLTGALSHELIEAVTDPYPSTNQGRDSAFGSVDQDHFIWIVLGGGAEASDLCVGDPNAFYKPAGFDFTVQRSWSNKLGQAGHNPCAPNAAGVPYFNSAPVLTEDVSLDLSVLGGGPTGTKGVLIPVGKSKTIEVDLFSDAATSGPWTVAASDTLAKLTGGAPTLDFKWDRTTGVNGEKLHLTVTVKAAASLVTGAHPFAITSTLGNAKFAWPGLVTDQ